MNSSDTNPELDPKTNSEMNSVVEDILDAVESDSYVFAGNLDIASSTSQVDAPHTHSTSGPDYKHSDLDNVETDVACSTLTTDISDQSPDANQNEEPAAPPTISSTDITDSGPADNSVQSGSDAPPTIPTTDITNKDSTEYDAAHKTPAAEGEEVPKNVVWLKKQVNSSTAPLSKSLTQASSKMKSLKQWGISTFKCTKQAIAEQMGSTPRSVDPELEASVEALRESKRQYTQLLNVAKALLNHFYCVVHTQRLLGETFLKLVPVSPEIEEDLKQSSKIQRSAASNGEIFLGSLGLFISSLDTLCNTTIDDTLVTYKQCEQARIRFDAHPRSDVDDLILTSQADSDTLVRVEAAKKEFEEYKVKYEKLKADVAVKMQLLEENKVQVLRRQLMLLQNACATCFAGVSLEAPHVSTIKPSLDQ